MFTLSFGRKRVRGAWNTYFLWIKPSRPVGMKSFLLLAHLKTVLRRNQIRDVNDTPSFPKMKRSLSGVCHVHLRLIKQKRHIDFLAGAKNGRKIISDG